MKNLPALLLGLLGISLNAACVAANFICPPQLQVSQEIKDDTKEWKKFNVDEKYPYIGVSFSQGTPDKKVILAPTSEKKRAGNIVATWLLPPTTEGYWIACLYNGTSAIIAKQLEANVTSCEVEYDARFSSPVAKKWHCNTK